jgi:transglutaminase-like putative cysteine protease
LFVSQVAVYLLHITNLDQLWIGFVLLACMVWRVQVFRGHWSYPPSSLKVILLLLSVVMLVTTFENVISLDILVAALLVGYGLKLLEMYTRRDALVLVYLSFFIIMTTFLFDQGVLTVLAGFAALMLVVTSWIGLYQEQSHLMPGRTFKMGFVMVLQSLPLMVLMFVVFPRLPSFWSVPMQQSSARTGMGDTMTPGDFTRLVQSADPAFRVTFKGLPPPSNELYWRGLVLDKFDGRTWTPNYFTQGLNDLAKRALWFENRAQMNKMFGDLDKGDSESREYEVIIEPTRRQWLFSLGVPEPLTEHTGLTPVLTLVKRQPLNERFLYQVRSYPRDMLPSGGKVQAHNLDLPEASNPRAVEYSLKIMEESSSHEDFLQRILDQFNRDFFYSLELEQKLGQNPVDEFLFDTRTGFCEHFSSAFVFLARAAGLPARVVIGYQGGEINPTENYLLVRQYDAHAWAEVWLEGRGWVRYDPTFAVAPERVLNGFRQAFQESGELDLPLFSLNRYSHLGLIKQLQHQIDRINYLWVRTVLGFNRDSQRDLLKSLFGQRSFWVVTAISLGVACGFLVLLYGFIWWREREVIRDPVIRQYRTLLAKLKRVNILLGPGESPQQLLVRIQQQDPELADKLHPLLEKICLLLYQPGLPDREQQLTMLSGSIKNFRPGKAGRV